MRCDIVEGESGIFPEPISRIMRGIGGLFGGGTRRRRDENQASNAETGSSGEPADTDTPGPDGRP